MAIFSAMNDLGALLLTQTNITNITTDNIGRGAPLISPQSSQRVYFSLMFSDGSCEAKLSE